MRKKNYKGRCEKVSVSKSKDVCRLYSEIQKKYLRMLEENNEILDESVERNQFSTVEEFIEKIKFPYGK